MVRKQLYITGAQEAALKERSARFGVSEGVLVRAALDVAFGYEREMSGEQRDAFDSFMAAAARIRAKEPRPDQRTYDRNDKRRFSFITKQRR